MRNTRKGVLGLADEDYQLWGAAVDGEALSFAERMRAARAHIHLTQEQVATRAGITQVAVSNLEKGKKQLSHYVLELALAMRVDPLWLQSGEGTPPLRVLNISDLEKQMLTKFGKLPKAGREAVKELVRPDRAVKPANNKSIGERVRLRRLELGYSQVALSAEASLAQPNLARLERDKGRRVANPLLLAAALQVPIDWLILGYGSMAGPRAKLSQEKIDFLLSFRSESPAMKKKVLAKLK